MYQIYLNVSSIKKGGLSMYFLQGLLVGLATFAPIGMQNLFIINTALVQPLPRILLTITIIGLFDMTLSMAAFYGIGAILDAWPVFNLIILIAGGLLVVYLGYKTFKTTPSLKKVDTNIPIKNILLMALLVTWGNPQAIIDASMMLGAFRANIPAESIYHFFFGFLAMTPIWFGFLAGTMYVLAKKIKISHLVWINRVCGTVLIIYGIKLVYDGILMMLSI